MNAHAIDARTPTIGIAAAIESGVDGGGVLTGTAYGGAKTADGTIGDGVEAARGHGSLDATTALELGAATTIIEAPAAAVGAGAGAGSAGSARRAASTAATEAGVRRRAAIEAGTDPRRPAAPRLRSASAQTANSLAGSSPKWSHLANAKTMSSGWLQTRVLRSSSSATGTSIRPTEVVRNRTRWPGHSRVSPPVGAAAALATGTQVSFGTQSRA